MKKQNRQHNDRIDLEIMKRVIDKKIVVEVEVPNNVDRQLLADSIACELQKKYNVNQ